MYDNPYIIIDLNKVMNQSDFLNFKSLWFKNSMLTSKLVFTYDLQSGWPNSKGLLSLIKIIQPKINVCMIDLIWKCWTQILIDLKMLKSKFLLTHHKPTFNLYGGFDSMIRTLYNKNYTQILIRNKFNSRSPIPNDL